MAPKNRSDIMRAVGRKNTGPEMRVRRVAYAIGLRYRLHRRDLPGTPDLVFTKHSLCLFVHGCFWHRHSGCRKATVPKTRSEYWLPKFAANMERDARVAEYLRSDGWRVETIWECETENPLVIERRLREMIQPRVQECIDQ